MRRLIPSMTLAAASLFWLAACGGPGAPSERHVVLVSVDGLADRYLDDSRAQLPTLRNLAAAGARAGGMVTSFPSVTWPAHTTLVTGATPGRHGIIGNSVLDRLTGEQVGYIGDAVFDKNQCVKVPTLYDAVHDAGLTTASIIWPATRAAKKLDWNIPDVRGGPDPHTTPGLAGELEAAGIPFHSLTAWGWGHEYAAMRDATYTRIATHLLSNHQPNLLLVHLVTPDAVQHDYGPDNADSRWAAANADDRIREIWETLQQGPLVGNADLFVVSDHGFAPVTKQVRPNVMLRKMGLIGLDGNGKAIERKAWVHASGGSAGVYIFDRQDAGRIAEEISARLAEIEGIARVLKPAEFERYGLPNPEENTQQADLMLSAEPGYGIDGRADGEELVADTPSRQGAHGHLPDREFMHAAFVAAGAHIRSGVKLNEISSLDVAPTIAAILGVEMPEAEGRVLHEILK